MGEGGRRCRHGTRSRNDLIILKSAEGRNGGRFLGFIETNERRANGYWDQSRVLKVADGNIAAASWDRALDLSSLGSGSDILRFKGASLE